MRPVIDGDGERDPELVSVARSASPPMAMAVVSSLALETPSEDNALESFIAT